MKLPQIVPDHLFSKSLVIPFDPRFPNEPVLQPLKNAIDGKQIIR